MEKLVMNCETGEETISEMTEAEIELAENLSLAAEQRNAEKATAKAALLEKLGITQEEAALLLS